MDNYCPRQSTEENAHKLIKYEILACVPPMAGMLEGTKCTHGIGVSCK